MDILGVALGLSVASALGVSFLVWKAGQTEGRLEKLEAKLLELQVRDLGFSYTPRGKVSHPLAGQARGRE